MASKKDKKAAQLGHNSVDKQQLLSIVERVENLEEEKSGIATDIKEVMAEAKGNGYDTKTIRRVIKQRATDKAELEESQILFETYLRALGESALD